MTHFNPNPFPGFVPTGIPGISNRIIQSTVSNFTKGEKAGTNGSLVVMIVDESGSMGSYKSQTISGYNEFLQGQEKDGDQTYISLVKFEGNKITKPYSKVHVKEAPRLNDETYTPCGGTNLLDAIGVTIQDVDAFLKELPENERPSVVIVIQTDGAENSSRSFNNETIKALIQDREENQWTFMFLGANIDAFATGAAFGMNTANTANYAMGATMDTFQVMSTTVSKVKSARSMGMSTEAVYSTAMYTDEDRAKMTGKKE